MNSVSVVIPAFNAESFIDETIQSVLAQTHRELEVLVVDDGSSDSTRARVQQYGSPVRLITQERKGPAVARNAGASGATGEWMAFLDADDVWMPNKLEAQLAAAASEHAPFVFSDRYNIGDRGPLPETQGDVQPLHDGDIFRTLLAGNFITTSTVLIRRDVFLSAGGFSEDPKLPPAEDWDFWLRVTHDHKAAACRQPLVKYRHHTGGISRNVTKMNAARRLVISRALTLPRAQRFTNAEIRSVWAETWATNGWDAARHGNRGAALQAYGRAVASAPTRVSFYKDILRVLASKS